jgi:hypothetical protein
MARRKIPLRISCHIVGYSCTEVHFMAWSLLAADVIVVHWHHSPTKIEGSGKMPSRCCMAVQHLASFSSNIDAVGRGLSHASDAWHAQLRRCASVLPASVVAPTDISSTSGSRPSSGSECPKNMHWLACWSRRLCPGLAPIACLVVQVLPLLL